MTDDDDLLSLVRRTNALLTTLVKIQLHEVIASELADGKKRKLYALTEPSRPVREIAKKVSLSTGTISQTWQRWEQMGMLIKEQGTYRRIV